VPNVVFILMLCAALAARARGRPDRFKLDRRP